MTQEKYYDSYPQALRALADDLKNRVFSPDEYYIVLTPDRYTQTVEDALFSGGGALDCEVLTLSRLARRVTPDEKILSREGGVMITASAIEEIKDEFKYYRRAANFDDFAREAYRTLLQISASDADAGDIKARGAVANKLHDLALIKKHYDERKQSNSDASDRLLSLIKAAPASELITRSNIITIGYSDITKLNKRVLSALRENARSYKEYNAAPPVDPRRKLELFCASDRIAQYKYIAAEIRDYIYGGDGRKYGDVSVVCAAPRTLARILREYDIAFYADESMPLAETPPLVALSYIYKLKSSADGETLVALCKNPYSGCDAHDAEKLQNYISTKGKYNVFDMEISDVGAARALARAKFLTDCFSGNFADACEAVIERGEFERIRAEKFDGDTDAVSPILSLTALVRKYGSQVFDVAANAFFAAARDVEIKTLPRDRDRVTVTSPQALRLTACKLLFLADFNEGVLPAVTADAGLLSDAELKELGGAIEPSVREQNRRERAELCAVAHNAQRLICTYHTAGGARPSAFIGELTENNNMQYGAEISACLAESDDANFIAKYACTESAAREIAARSACKHAPSITQAVGESDKTAAPFLPEIECQVKPTVSVSEFTHWFKCPYKRFLSDVVGVKERRASELDAPDFGILVHEFMRKFVQSAPLDCSREAVSRIVDDIIAARGIHIDDDTRSRLTDDALDYAVTNAAIIDAGDYIPESEERPFGGELFLGEHKTKFVGVIDRVDVCGDRRRIIDYKTFNKKFDMRQCLNGCDMQLPLYAAAIGGEVTGMFYVPLAPRYESQIKPLVGCVVKDAEIAQQYDNALSDSGTSSIMSVQLTQNKDGEAQISGRSGAAVERDVFNGLIEKCVSTAELAADEIASGYIMRSPTEDACEYCAYFGICGNVKTLRIDGTTEGDE